MSLTAAVVSAVRNDHGRQQCVWWNVLCATFGENHSHPMFICSILWKVFGQKNLLDFRRFWSKFYHQHSTYSISLHYYCARINSLKSTLQCCTIIVNSPLTLNNYTYSILFCFSWYKQCTNPPINTRVIVKNKVERFYGSQYVYIDW